MVCMELQRKPGLFPAFLREAITLLRIACFPSSAVEPPPGVWYIRLVRGSGVRR